MSSLNRYTFFLFLLIVSVYVQSVFAETGDVPQNGFKITKDTVLNVGLSITPEYETNVTKASENTIIVDNTARTTEKVGIVSDLILHYSPSIRIKLDDTSKTVGFSIFFDYNHYIGLDDSTTSKKLSDLDIRSNFLGEFNKDGVVFFGIDNNFSRTANPDSQDLSGRHKNILESFAMDLGFKNLEDTLLMKIQAGVDFNYLEESKDELAYKDYNYVSFVGDIFGRWKFLPKTIVFLNAAFRYQDYYESNLRSDSLSIPFNVFAGLMGQITPYISAKLSAGYSASFSKDTKHDYNANAEFIFKYNKSTFLNIGYLRNMRPSPYFQYYSTHRLYLNFKQKFARDFFAKLDFSYSFIAFGPQVEFNSSEYTFNTGTDTYDKDTMTTNAGTLDYSVKVPGSQRDDRLMVVNPSLSYNILSWLGLKLSYEMEYRTSDYYKEITGIWNDANDSNNDYNRTVHTEYDFLDHRVLFTIALDY